MDITGTERNERENVNFFTAHSYIENVTSVNVNRVTVCLGEQQACVFVCAKVTGTWCRERGRQRESESQKKPLFAARCHALSWNSICSLTGMKWH